MTLKLIIQILEASIQKHGNQTLTHKDLLNILKKADALLQRDADECDSSIEDTY